MWWCHDFPHTKVHALKFFDPRYAAGGGGGKTRPTFDAENQSVPNGKPPTRYCSSNIYFSLLATNAMMSVPLDATFSRVITLSKQRIIQTRHAG